jgi:hypothetical protein
VKLWHPHTERPECVCSCLIALPPDELSEGFTLAGTFYTYDPRTNRFRCEETDVPLIAKAFFWANEADVLQELEVAR